MLFCFKIKENSQKKGKILKERKTLKKFRKMCKCQYFGLISCLLFFQKHLFL